ncbi:hypothetical protein [Gelidibacter pelagius]|uniref:SGNH/GDSL hydrolase family protein n=1 Tax=Gelidibacter pelagius TaxID=2819985 RepID=A0ABS3SQF3_9FLAO|nr:hypothetical protein [Gelidibacter pelagius]MBO3097914.1 hypothetical protein [Gelidibacter pelagius]
MKKFLKNIFPLLLITIVVGEVVVRLTHAVADLPQRTIDGHGVQKYLPNQEGYWKGGEHNWTINKFGWPGKLPQSYDNLIMVIGDSFIENFMNPNECHQSVFLKENMKDYNFMEAGRSGVSLIEALEISKQFDSLKPIQFLIYVNDEDFYESISQIKPMDDITQLNIDTNTIEYGKMKTPGLKKILYAWKLMYYLYNRFPLTNLSNIDEKPEVSSKDTNNKELEFQPELTQLMAYIKCNYTINNKTLVFHPDSSKSIIAICQAAGFNIIFLDSNNDETWVFDYDSHWTCYGHKRAAEQISEQLPSILNNSEQLN